MKLFSLFLLFTFSLLANDAVHKFAPSKDCKACHAQIYSEFYSSMHANSTPNKDPIHKAVWDKHPSNKKFERYTCGKCHTPAADNLDKMMTKGEKALPDTQNATHQEAISCAYCHRIQSIEKHAKSNTNIISKTPKAYYGTMKNNLESPYHEILTDDNNLMKSGNTCIGCHSHKMNKFKLNVCSTDIKNRVDGANCVSCHMPKVKGSASSIHDTKTHSFHGFAGSHFNSEMLAKYVDISIVKNKDSFTVNIDNQSSHALLLHPLRVAVLKISVKRDDRTIKLKKEVFVRVIGKEGKPAMPWVATSVIKDTMIKGNEKRAVKRDFKLQKGDRVDIVLGWFLVNPKAVKKLGLENEKVATEFHVFKKQSFSF
jgi:hypothetical protein